MDSLIDLADLCTFLPTLLKSTDVQDILVAPKDKVGLYSFRCSRLDCNEEYIEE